MAAKAAKFPWELATAAKTDVSIRPLMANVQGLLSLLKAGKVTVTSLELVVYRLFLSHNSQDNSRTSMVRMVGSQRYQRSKV